MSPTKAFEKQKAKIVKQTMYHEIKLLSSSFVLFLLFQFSTSTDTITSNQSIKDGDIVISNAKSFALGFFSPDNSTKRYVGIWYYKVSEQTVVWVANRDSPINDTSGILSIDRTGNLVIHDRRQNNIPLWSTNASALSAAAAAANNCSAQLLDSGNLVLFPGDSKRVVAWQSFDYPTNTMLPDMKLGADRRTGLNWFLTSWKSREDPGTGEYSYKMDLSGLPEFFLYKGSDPVWRTGPWNGLRWSGVPAMNPNSIFNVIYVDNDDEVSVIYGIHNASIFSRLMVNETGIVGRLTWHDGGRGWVGFWSSPKDTCDEYNGCGAYGDCDPRNASDFKCTCLPGFEPKSARDWYMRDGSGGCVRKRGRQVCGSGDGFVKVTNAKLPDTLTARADQKLGIKACKELCLSNCSCTAYTNADIRGEGSGCMIWYGELVDTREYTNGGQDLYVRVDAVELAQYSKSKKGHQNRRMVAIIAASVALASFLAIFLAYWLVMNRRKGRKREIELLSSPLSLRDSPRVKELDENATSSDLPFFYLSTIVAATDNFSSANKLGQGGFGSVYKGHLNDGQEIAVKRLSKKSGQGIEEFKNEVTLIAKLQHRNLVRLLGCCIQQEEKMLIYEYLPNRSLDSFIFDKTRGAFVDWRKRFDIVLGIVRGMIYLHQDSRLRIIHRDLKASNVLLDAAMNPKISDFGMAKMFEGDEIEANTKRVVGTYGYMAPEYAMGGLFSVKSDVFSFGVLLLEIISGTRNNSYYKENSVNLIGHVWDLWREGKALEIVDSALDDSYSADEVLRCIHIGLQCVQEVASDRPTMSAVAFMLCNETVLPPPNQPAFIFRTKLGQDSSSASAGANSINDVTMSKVEAR